MTQVNLGSWACLVNIGQTGMSNILDLFARKCPPICGPRDCSHEQWTHPGICKRITRFLTRRLKSDLMCCTEFVFCWLSPTLKTLWWAFSILWNVPPVLNFANCEYFNYFCFSILWHVNVSSSAVFFLSRWVRSLNCSSRTSVSMTRLQQNGQRGDHHQHQPLNHHHHQHHQHQHQH